jgi:hypothetical protein
VQRLPENLIVKALLTAAAGMTGGLVAVMIRAKVGLGAGGAVLTDGLKDLSKLLVKQDPRAPDLSALTAYPMNPLEWQNRASKDASIERTAAEDVIHQWSEALAHDQSFRFSFDPEQLFKEKLTIGGVPIREIVELGEEEGRLGFAKAFWREWLLAYGHTVGRATNLMMSNVNVVARPHDVYYVEDNTQGVAAEIDKLGEDGSQWVAEHGGSSRRAAEHEIRDRNEMNTEERRPGVL